MTHDATTASPTREPFELTAEDGWRLRGELLLPPAPRAVAVCGHAMMVDRRTLDRPPGAGLVSTLAAHGIAVVWPDLRGHGQSGPRADAGGDWTYDDLVADVPVLLRLARERVPGVRTAAVGHSLFGHVTLAHLARHPDTPLDALVLIGGNVSNPRWRRRPLSWSAKLAGATLMAGLTAPFGRLPVRRLRYGTDDEARGYVADFLRMAVRAEWRARDGFDYYAVLPRVRTDVLALVGADDRHMAPLADVEDLLAPVARKRIEVVGRRSGLAFDPGHMALVLDPRCRPAWERAARFITDGQ